MSISRRSDRIRASMAASKKAVADATCGWRASAAAKSAARVSLVLKVMPRDVVMQQNAIRDIAFCNKTYCTLQYDIAGCNISAI